MENTLRIYLTNAIVNKYNLRYIEALPNPAFKIRAKNNLKNARSIKYSDTGNLHQNFYYIKGSKIILTKNP